MNEVNVYNYYKTVTMWLAISRQRDAVVTRQGHWQISYQRIVHRFQAPDEARGVCACRLKFVSVFVLLAIDLRCDTCYPPEGSCEMRRVTVSQSIRNISCCYSEVLQHPAGGTELRARQ
jgi:hypothetical protein